MACWPLVIFLQHGGWISMQHLFYWGFQGAHLPCRASGECCGAAYTAEAAHTQLHQRMQLQSGRSSTPSTPVHQVPACVCVERENMIVLSRLKIQIQNTQLRSVLFS